MHRKVKASTRQAYTVGSQCWQRAMGDFIFPFKPSFKLKF